MAWYGGPGLGMAWRGKAVCVSRNVAASRREFRRTDGRRDGSTSAIRRTSLRMAGVFLFTAMSTLTKYEIECLVVGKTGAVIQTYPDTAQAADPFVEKTPGNDRRGRGRRHRRRTDLGIQSVQRCP